jgi:hypothetical protein
MLWTRGARVSKDGHRATAEHALRPGGVLHARAGAGDAGGTRDGTGTVGATWGEQKRASAGLGRRLRGRGGHVDWCRAALGRRGRGTWPAERRRPAGGETEEVRLEEEDKDQFVILQKYKDLTVILLSPYSGRARSGPRSKMGLGEGFGAITDRFPYKCLGTVRPCKHRFRQLGFVLCLIRVS